MGGGGYGGSCMLFESRGKGIVGGGYQNFHTKSGKLKCEGKGQVQTGL